jgi:hypothetical protein
MSSTSFAATNSFLATIDFALRPSLRVHRMLFFLHLIPLALSVFALQPGVPMMLFAAAMGLSWTWLRRHPAFGFGRHALVRLIWQADGSWTVFDNAGGKFEAELLSRSCVHAQLMVLCFKLSTGERRTRVVLGDELGADPLRRLRARLAMVACAA